MLPGRLLKRASDRGTFCSQLVAQVVVRVGAEEFARTPLDRFPAIIEQLAGPENITEQIFRPALAPSDAEEMCALDGEFAVSLSSPQTLISARIGGAVRPLAEPIARHYPEAGLEPSDTLRGAIQFVINAIDRVGRMSPPRYELYVDAVAGFDEVLAREIAKGELIALFEQIYAFDEATLQRNVAESFAAEPDIDVTAMKALRAAAAKELRTRRASIAGLEDYAKLSVAVATYLPIGRTSLAALERRDRITGEILTRLGVTKS